MTNLESKHDWQLLAKRLAEDAGTNHMSSRRGIWSFNGSKFLCLFNNNPYANDPTERDRETARILELLQALGIHELAYAVYPESGESAGYTYALLVDGDKKQIPTVNAAVKKAYLESFERLVACSAGQADSPATSDSVALAEA